MVAGVSLSRLSKTAHMWRIGNVASKRKNAPVFRPGRFILNYTACPQKIT